MAGQIKKLQFWDRIILNDRQFVLQKDKKKTNVFSMRPHMGQGPHGPNWTPRTPRDQLTVAVEELQLVVSAVVGLFP